MPIELNKILRDIAEESSLKPTANAQKEETEQAWARVAKKSNLSVHETKSIFKVLQKKYEQERTKNQSTWKLFGVMTEIHTPAEEDEEDGESEISMEENEEYEMLEVDEEQQQDLQQKDGGNSENIKIEQPTATKSTTLKKTNSEMMSDGESPNKSKSDTSHENSPERVSEKQTTPRDEKKLLNALLSPNSPRLAKPMNATSAAIALQKKGITLKKANTAQKPQTTQPIQAPLQITGPSLLRNSQVSEIGRTIQLPESIKRKLNEDSSPAVAKKILLGQPSGAIKQISAKPVAPKTLSQSKITSTGGLLIKKNTDEKNTANNAESATTLSTPTVTTHHGLKVITFPVETKNEASSSNTAGLKVISLPVEGSGSIIQNGLSTQATKNATNGISTSQIEELDFSDHVLISTNAANNVNDDSAATLKTENIPNNMTTSTATQESSFNLGNFSDELPRTFFKNLCDSNRYEALCLYAANVLNRLDAAAAARLEITIMRALLAAQNDALKDL